MQTDRQERIYTNRQIFEGETDVRGPLKLGGVALTVTAAILNALTAAGAAAAATIATVLAGTAQLLLPRAGATAVSALRFGATAAEGLAVKVLETTLTLTGAAVDLAQNLPAGAVVLSVQANVEVLAVAGGTSVKIGIGTASDPDKYGLSAALTKNTKINTLPDWAVLAEAEDVQVYACATNGAAGDTEFSAGSLRVRIAYLAADSLADAA